MFSGPITDGEVYERCQATTKGINSTYATIVEQRSLEVLAAGTGTCVITVCLHFNLQPEESTAISDLLISNNIHPRDFAQSVQSVLKKTIPRKNCLLFLGPPSTGKSLLAKLIAQPLYWGDVDANRNSTFPYEKCLNRQIVLEEEARITPDSIDSHKLLWGGEPFHVNVKHQTSRLLQRTPTIATMNSHPKFCNPVDVTALFERVYLFNMTKKVPAMPYIITWQELYKSLYHWLL